MNGRIILILLAPLLLLARPAHAAGNIEKARTARTACLAGDYAKGVAILAELFVDSLDPTYIYNQARCFEQNRRYEDAISRFQEYLRVGTGAKETDKAEAHKHIAECQELLAKQVGQAAVPAPPAAAPGVAPPPVAVVAPPPAPPVQQIATTSPPPPPLVASSGSGLRTAGIVTAAIGGAGIVAGVIFNLKFNGVTSDMQGFDGYTTSRASDRDTYKALAWTGYGLGAACIATGAVLYYLGLRSGQTSASSVALVPALSPGNVGALLQGAF